MKRVTEGHVLNRVWARVGYLVLDTVSDRVRGRVVELVWNRVSDRVRGRVAELVWSRVSDHVGDTWGTHGEYEVES